MTNGTPRNDEMASRLQAMETMVERYAQLAVVNQLAAARMHEVNNPLEALTHLVYLLQREDPLPERARGRVEELQMQLSLLADVASHSLSFHRGQDAARPVDLIGVAESALRLHDARLSRRCVQVVRRFPEQAVCHGISGELFQVVSNLILNALDAMPEDTDASLHVRIRRGHQLVHLTVADNGSGVPPHMHTTLFEPHATSKVNGSGLGLWLSERILKRHRGTIRMRTSCASGKSGTVFCISLPQTMAA